MGPYPNIRPIIRAGTGMIDGVVTMIPNAKIGHIGLYRDEKTVKPVRYYYKMPEGIDNKQVIIIAGRTGC